MGILIISGAGLSAPSGAPTFNGKYPIYNNVDLLQSGLEQLEQLKPNTAHKELSTLQSEAAKQKIRVRHITLNVDDLNEVCGATVEHVYGRARDRSISELANIDFYDLSWISEKLIILVGLSGLGFPLAWLESYCRNKQKKVISFNLVVNQELECYQCVGDAACSINADRLLSYYESLT
ncbi:SIR2 family NAD-dependent protein deacylase [Idiomarina baltica]|uniref:Deacetylase sirtuin-type domain-containing protein n=1 Tax=Idiomarina baltica OS145 TaxID=314276 RepID=A0ABM9WLF8_9GAMM|nr:hypothetical protein [Idiomarina baltica]EAQ31774.1 hypothetical protein OS145_06719 [Idiomarina baltica OS145]